jgi:hypothetical protein
MENRLKALVNRKIVVLGPDLLDREQLQTVTLLSVEEAGIWITSKEVVAGLVEKFKVAPSSPDLALFLPYGQIEAILAAFDAAAA